MVQFTKLRLTGFKSFVEPTELDIGSGLTGIVGPNGCGKSNLTEALRWVMGENSPKRMRSSGMDDVIFSGTDDRPARNTAEVCLLLDNTDRRAPAEMNDSDELEVSRKIERSVGSTYKVNGKNVRMRDVQILFADSSIGSHSPALVSQGRVADMINAKPTQRRMVLEEAAGISGLHARRHEAELKLRAAETNLLRVEDVLGAMNTQLEGLKKQARQASRYRNLSGHIQTAEGSLLFLKFQASQIAVTNALASFDLAENAVREKTLEVTTLTTEQTEAAAGLPELRQAEAEAAAALQHLKLAYGTLENEARLVEEERVKSQNLLSQYTRDVAHETAQKTEAAETMARLTEERAALEDETARQSEREEEARILRDELQNAVEKSETELTLLTEETAAQEAARGAAERQIADLERRLEAARRSRRERVQVQDAPFRVEAAQRVVLQGAVRRPHAVPLFEMADQRGRKIAFGNAESGGQLLRGPVQLVDVVVDEVEEVAHLLVRRRLGEGCGAAERVVEGGELLGIAPVCLMRGDQRMGEAGRVLGDELQLLKVGAEGFEQRVGKRLRQGGKQTVALAGREVGDVDAERLGQRQENGGRDRALVVLDLVQIAGRDADALGEAGLRQAVGLAQVADLAADEQLRVSHFATLSFAIMRNLLYAPPPVQAFSPAREAIMRLSQRGWRDCGRPAKM